MAFCKRDKFTYTGGWRLRSSFSKHRKRCQESFKIGNVKVKKTPPEHKCQQCEYIARTPWKLVRHVETHNNIPKECPKCKRCFTRSDHFSSHALGCQTEVLISSDNDLNALHGLLHDYVQQSDCLSIELAEMDVMIPSHVEVVHSSDHQINEIEADEMAGCLLDRVLEQLGYK